LGAPLRRKAQRRHRRKQRGCRLADRRRVLRERVSKKKQRRKTKPHNPRDIQKNRINLQTIRCSSTEDESRARRPLSSQKNHQLAPVHKGNNRTEGHKCGEQFTAFNSRQTAHAIPGDTTGTAAAARMRLRGEGSSGGSFMIRIARTEDTAA
jgi:hypothetical protein